MKLRGGTVKKLHISESAFIKDRSELNAGSKQAVPIDGWISEETTANGFNEFFDFYNEQHLKQNNLGSLDYKTYFYPWVINPEYSIDQAIEQRTELEDQIVSISKDQFGIEVTDSQLAWRRWKINELKKGNEGLGLSGEQLFKQEYPLTISEAFQSGTGNVFDTTLIDKMNAQPTLTLDIAIQELKNNWPNEQVDSKIQQLKSLYEKGVRFWKVPIPGTSYIIGCDPSDGEGSDFGVIDVWSDTDIRYEQIAQYYGKLRPDDLATLNADIGLFYNEGFIGVENNMLSTVLFLSKIYSNYYFDTRIDERTQKRTKKLGWNTNIKTRDVAIDDFIILFEEDHLLINSNITIGEMKTFVRKDNGKREHADGKFDDALFAAFIALQMRKFNKPRARAFTTKPF